MKLFPFAAWFSALTVTRRKRRRDADPGDMGTAFGLDSITIVDFEPSEAPAAPTSSKPDWQRRLARRSRL